MSSSGTSCRCCPGRVPITGPPSTMRIRASGCSPRRRRATAAPMSPLPTMRTSASRWCVITGLSVCRPYGACGGVSVSVGVAAEGGVEGGGRQLPQERSHELLRLARTVLAPHTGVLPLDRDRAGVADVAKGAEGVLPGDVAVAGRDEVPAAARVTPRQVGAEDTRATV